MDPEAATGRALVEEWDLVADGDPVPGGRSWVLPVLEPTGRPAVLAVRRGDGAGDAEGLGSPAYEHLALQHWHGRGAVLLRRADPRRRALLLERVGPRSLDSVEDVAACEVAGGLLAGLAVPAPPQLPRLSDVVREVHARLAAVPRGAPLPHRLVDQARALARGLAADPATDGTLLHGDLRGSRVLAGEREPWLVVAPAPVSGDPHAEPAPMLWHRWSEVVASGDVRGAVRRRFHALVDAAGLDEDRARDWVVLLTVARAVGGLAGPVADRDRTTALVAVAKAVQG